MEEELALVKLMDKVLFSLWKSLFCVLRLDNNATYRQEGRLRPFYQP